jgi:16S rRNA (guanine966-N2)-methyltransferase
MRIIAGTLRGRRFEAPEGVSTRPMLDRVREALFSTAGDWIEGARVLDLFAGSGSLGMEALSRGAARARFVERDRRAAAVLRANLAELGLKERSELVLGDGLDPARWSRPADLVFLDPPYAFLDDGRLRRRVFAAVRELVDGVLDPSGLLVFHAPKRRVVRTELEGVAISDERDYGTNTLFYLRPAGAGARRGPAPDACGASYDGEEAP